MIFAEEQVDDLQNQIRKLQEQIIALKYENTDLKNELKFYLGFCYTPPSFLPFESAFLGAPILFKRLFQGFLSFLKGRVQGK